MRIAFISLGIWIALILLCLPFPFDWLPRAGEWLASLLAPMLETAFGFKNKFGFASDSKIYFIQSTFLLLPSIFVAVSITRWQSSQKTFEFVHTALAYMTAFFLLKYGFVKVMQHQFYTIEPNIAHTPVGQLSKDLLFWTSMGTSYSYNLFMGAVEIIAGLLLLWNRTRMLGGIISLGVFMHVFAINVGFDITVKLLSLTLLAASVLICLRYYKVLLNTFLFHKNTPSKQNSIIIDSIVLRRSIKGLIVSLFIFECLYPFVQEQDMVANLQETNGTYLVSNNDSKSALFDNIKRIHFHSNGYLITEDFDQKFEDFKMVETIHSIEIEMPTGKLSFDKKITQDTLYLSQIKVDDSSKLTLLKSNNESLPVNQDSFHWTLESIK